MPERRVALPSFFRKQTTYRAFRARVTRLLRAVSVLLAAGSCAMVYPHPAGAAPARLPLSRKYHRGDKMHYHTRVSTAAVIRSNPLSLMQYLPPSPLDVTLEIDHELSVQSVDSDGSADLEDRIDSFHFRPASDAPGDKTQLEAVREFESEYSRRIVGLVLKLHRGPKGKLLSRAEAVSLSQSSSAPNGLVESLHALLGILVGAGLYPAHPVKQGDSWATDFSVESGPILPLAVQGKNILRFEGTTHRHGVKAAVIDFHFTSALQKPPEHAPPVGLFALFEGKGMALDMRIQGEGEGRALIALKDGRVLENKSTLHETVRATLKGLPGVPLPPPGPGLIEIDARDAVEAAEAE